ncbi:MAG: NfeD family protein [Planctomycetota bacterium]
MAKILTVFITAWLFLWQNALAQSQTAPTGAPQPEKAKTSDLNAPKTAAPGKVKACVITLDGTIDGGLQRSIERRTKAAKEAGCSLIFYKINTYGGGLFVAYEICDFISALDIRTVAYIPDKAISAGAMIAVACNEIVMGTHSLIGDCEPIVPHPEQGMLTLPEKTQSFLRARLGSLAERNGYPVLLVEAMVTKEMEVYQVTIGNTTKYMTKGEIESMTDKEKERITRKILVVEEGRLLTMRQNQAKDYGFAKAIVANDKELYDLYGVREPDVLVLDPNLTEKTARLLDTISPLLLVIGLMALYVELKAPGFGLPGVIAILCFAAFFASKYFIGLAENWEVLIFLLGLALLAVEIFVIPGFGITGIAGIVLIAVAIMLSFQPFIIPRTPFEVDMTKAALLKMLGSIAASIVGICILARFLPETSLFGRIVLKTAETTGAGYVVESAERQDLVGREGVAVSKLRPVGRAQIGDEICSVVTQGELVEEGRKVKVLEVKGNRIVVRET